MADDYDPKKLLDDRNKIRAKFSEWKNSAEFNVKGIVEGSRTRMLKAALGSLEMEAMGKVGRASIDTILSEASSKVEELKRRGI